ncbi:MAG: hypothetical protein V1779_17795 [bacterium]
MSRKIGALWSRKSNDGKTFLSGMLNDLSGDIQIAVFKNDRKEKDNQPDYNIVLSEKREQKQNTQQDDFFGDQEPANNSAEEIQVDNIPFD